MDLAARITALIAAEPIEVGFAARHLPSGATVAIGEQAIFPTASVFKVPLMVEVYCQARAGRLALDERIALTDDVRTLPSGVLYSLGTGLAPTIRDLLVLMTIVSDNVATTMLLRRVGGPAAVNATMDSLGLSGLRTTIDVHEMFLHAFGLPLDEPVGLDRLRQTARERQMDYASLTFARTTENTVATAADTVGLMAMIAEGTAVDAEASADMIRIMQMQQYLDRVPRYLPWGKVANKTGTMRGVRNDAGIMLRGPDDRIAYALYSFDPTPLAVGNSATLVERNIRVATMMAEIGRLLWEHHGR